MKFTVSSALAVIALFSCPHSALAQAVDSTSQLFQNEPFPPLRTSTSTSTVGTHTLVPGNGFPGADSPAIPMVSPDFPREGRGPSVPFPSGVIPGGSPRWPGGQFPGHRWPGVLWPHPSNSNYTGIPRRPRPKYDRVQWLADRASIEQLNSDYAFALDSKRFDDLDTLFVSNATYNIPILNIHVEGVAAIKKALAGSIMKMHTQHVLTQPSHRIDTTSGTATSRVYLTESIYGQNGAPVTRTARGYFEDVLVRTRNGMHSPELEWRFVSRSFTILVSLDPTPYQVPA